MSQLSSQTSASTVRPTAFGPHVSIRRFHCASDHVPLVTESCIAILVGFVTALTVQALPFSNHETFLSDFDPHFFFEVGTRVCVRT